MATFPVFSAAFTAVFAVVFGWLFGGFFGDGALVGLAGVGLAGVGLALDVVNAFAVTAFLVGFSAGFATTLGLDLGFFEGLAVDTFSACFLFGALPGAVLPAAFLVADFLEIDALSLEEGTGRLLIGGRVREGSHRLRGESLDVPRAWSKPLALSMLSNQKVFYLILGRNQRGMRPKNRYSWIIRHDWILHRPYQSDRSDRNDGSHRIEHRR